MAKTMKDKLPQYLFTDIPIRDGDAFFSGRARAVRLFLAVRHGQKTRTNDEIAAAVSLGSGNVISMLKPEALGAHRSTVSDDNVLRLSREVGLEPLSGAISMLLIESSSPEIARTLSAELAEATPHFASFRTLAVAMADGCVAVPPGTAPEIAARIEEARQLAEESAERWTKLYNQLGHLWRGQDAGAETAAVHGPEGKRLLATAEQIVDDVV